MEEKERILPGVWAAGSYMEHIKGVLEAGLPQIPVCKSFPRTQCMNMPVLESNKAEDEEMVRINPARFAFKEFMMQKPDLLSPGEISTEDILRLIEERKEPMESLRGKSIKKVVIECEDGKTYAGRVTRIEGNPYDVRTCRVEAIIGNPIGTYGIEKVLFQNPATIVYWTDGTKTVVNCMDNVEIKEKMVDGKKTTVRKPRKCDTYSKETGLAMAIAKKWAGNQGNYNKIFREYAGEED